MLNNYNFQNYDLKNNLPYGDESYKIIVNTTAPAENTPPELIPFFNYVNRMEVPEGDVFIETLHRQVQKYNTSEWRRKLMTLEEKIKLELGMEKKRIFAEGETKARLENAKKMKEDGLDVERISKYTGLSIEEIKKI